MTPVEEKNWSLAFWTWEFKDKSIESEYFADKLRNTIPYLRLGIFIGLLYLSSIIPDYIIVKNNTTFSLLSANRLLFAAYIVFFVLAVKEY